MRRILRPRPLGPVLRRLREAHGLTDEKAAVLWDISVPSLQKAETGEPRAGTTERYLKTLNCTFEDLSLMEAQVYDPDRRAELARAAAEGRTVGPQAPLAPGAPAVPGQALEYLLAALGAALREGWATPREAEGVLAQQMAALVQRLDDVTARLAASNGPTSPPPSDEADSKKKT